MKPSEPHVAIVDYLHGRVADGEREKIRAHIESCPECQKLLVSYERIFGASREIGEREYKLGPAFSVEVMEQLEGFEPEKKHAPQRTSGFTEWFRENFMSAVASVCTCALVLMLTVTNLGRQASVAFSGTASSIALGSVGGTYSSPPVKPAPYLVQQKGNDAEKRRHVSGLPLNEDYQFRSESDLIAGAAGPSAAPPKVPYGIAEPSLADIRRGLNSTREKKVPSSIAKYDGADSGAGMGHYASYEEGKRFFVRDEPLSTFSIDVDTGSYTNVRNFLNRGQLPPADAVRIEEFLNYFDYAFRGTYNGPFGLDYEIAPSPLEKDRYLLKLQVKAREAAKTNVGWNLVFLVDTSGSMGPENRLGLVKQSLKMLTKSMRPIDRIALVAYSGAAGLVLDSTPGSERATILSAIDRLSSGGSTNGAAGIDLAYQVAESHFQTGGVNRVILATDGDFNVGNYSFNGLVDLVEKKRRSGVTLTTIGVGDDNYNDQNLEQLADKGNGNYFYLDSIQEAERTLIGRLSANMEVVAKDVKLQIEFNPQVVSAYRLVGYDNRRLAAEDFVNDKVDAGEVGSGHTVTALYEIALAGSPFAEQLAKQSRYSTPTGVAQVDSSKAAEFGFLKLRYKEPEGSTSKELQFPIERSKTIEDPGNASPDFRFAAAVSYFGHLLHQSKFAGNYSYSEVAALAADAARSINDDKKQEFIGLVKKAGTLSGKE